VIGSLDGGNPMMKSTAILSHGFVGILGILIFLKGAW
jgi:hypothetical protein